MQIYWLTLKMSTIWNSLYKLCFVGIGGSVRTILTQFPSNSSQHVMLDGCRSKLINCVSAVNLLPLCQPIIVPPVHLGGVFHSGDYADRSYRKLQRDDWYAILRC